MTGKSVSVMLRGDAMRVQAVENFQFLVQYFRMTQSLVKEDESMIIIAYTSDSIGFELELDLLEEQMFMLVVKLNDGELPSGYYLNNTETVRLHLEKLLRFYYGVNAMHQGNTFEQQLELYAELLKKYGARLLKQGFGLFEHPPV